MVKRRRVSFAPRRKRRRFTARRRLRGRRHTVYRRRSTGFLRNPKSSAGFPNNLYMTHEYEATYAYASSVTGLWINQKMALNGLYDPDITGVGSQPNFFDDMSAIYSKYNVYKCRVSITIVPKFLLGTVVQGSAGATVAVHAGATGDGWSSISSLADRHTAPNSWRMDFPMHAFGYGGPARPRTFKRTFFPHKFFDTPGNNPSWRGTSSANPVNLSEITVATRQIDGSFHAASAGGDYNFEIIINLKYFAHWSRPIMSAYAKD